jgi:competence protein ComEA
MAQRIDRAHLLLGVLVVLGIGWRALDRGGPAAQPDPELGRQIAAVESARAQRSAERGRKPSGTRSAASTSTPKPARRIESSVRVESTPAGARATTSPIRVAKSRPRLDLDVASASEIEALPRIGPALAGRIVEDRARQGPFGSLEALQRVKGIGPALAAQLAEYVTFGAPGRPHNVASAGAAEHSARPPKARPRTHR